MLLLIDFAGNGNTIFGLAPYYRSLAELKEKGLKCLAAKIQGEPPYLCAELYPTDLANALDDADLIGAKFMRYLPPFRGDTWHYQPLWKMQESTAATMAVVNGAAERADAGLRIVANNDPQVIIDLTDASAAMQACHRLRIQGELSRDAPIGDPAQLFYLAAGQQRFNEAHSVLAFPQAAEGDALNIEFNLKSLTGFAPRLRFDPARRQGVSVIRALEVACAQ
jgi:hypothetical protein